VLRQHIKFVREQLVQHADAPSKSA